MGVSVINYVVRGVFFDVEDLEKLPADAEHIWDHPDIVYADPMVNSSFIAGKILFKSDDGRYDDNSIPPIDVSGYSEIDLYESMEGLPEELLYLYLYEKVGEFGTWVFTQEG